LLPEPLQACLTASSRLLCSMVRTLPDHLLDSYSSRDLLLHTLYQSSVRH
jgi:hypothetical protein